MYWEKEIETMSREQLKTLQFIIKVEAQKEFFTGDLKQLESLRSRISEALKTDILITPKVKLVEPNSLPKPSGKTGRVIDNRRNLYD
jgi:phenylacetate-CoA ligase